MERRGWQRREVELVSRGGITGRKESDSDHGDVDGAWRLKGADVESR